MGIKISNIVEKKSISFDQLSGKKIAVDFSNAAYQFLSSIRQRDGTPLMDSKGNITSHLQGIFSRSCNLLQQGIKICYVFDGPPPQLKVKTQKERHEKKEFAKEKFEEAKEKQDKETMAKYAKQISRLTKDMVGESKELIQALGIPQIQAPSEADSQISFLCKNGDTWAVASSDMDLLLHQCPRIITNLTAAQRKKLPTGAYIKTIPEIIYLNQTLSELNISQEQLICLGILVGTDYNEGIHGIGQKKALKIVKELKTPEKIFQEHSLEDVGWKEVFDLYKNMKVEKNYLLEWKQPDQIGRASCRERV